MDSCDQSPANAPSIENTHYDLVMDEPLIMDEPHLHYQGFTKGNL
jgi:hypothetical protein